MRQNAGSPPLYLVSSTSEPRNQKLAQDAMVKLEECRAVLLEGEHRETVKLLDIVLLQLRMEMLDISEAEFKAVCATIFAARGHALHGPDRV